MTSSPLRPFQSSLASSRSECARTHWAGNPGRSSFPTRILPASVPLRLVSVKGPPSENEEEDLDDAARSIVYFFQLSLPITALSSGISLTGDLMRLRFTLCGVERAVNPVRSRLGGLNCAKTWMSFHPVWM